MSNSLPSSSLLKVANEHANQNVNPDLSVLSSDITEPTATQIWGPFYVQNAPFRAKISPVHAVGIPMIIKGRVFGLDTRRPLAFVSIDIWHASSEAQYDYHEADRSVEYPYKEELNTHGLSSHFDYRARLVTDEQGRYEYETVKPAPYFNSNNSSWRCPHVHYYVQALGYKSLVTQLYFKGEEKNDVDRYITKSNTIELESIECQRSDGSKLTYLQGEFNIVLAANSTNKDDN